MAAHRVVLIDANWLIFRAYNAIPSNFRTGFGLPTNAVYGFALMFRKLLAARQADFGAAVFDGAGPTARDDAYPDYKAQRPTADEDLSVQVPWIHDVINAHRYPILKYDGYEADDVIGTLTRQAVADGCEVHIIAGDKDFAQLIGGDVRMIDTMRDITFDAELVFKKWGARPDQFVDYLALVGDSVDNIPGVPGIGKKTAGQLLAEYGNLEAILANVDNIKSTRARNALSRNADSARLSQQLARIDQYAKIDLRYTDLPIPAIEPDDQQVINELFNKLEFYSLLSQTELADAGDMDTTAEYTVYTTTASVAEWVDSLPFDQPLAVFPLFECAPPILGELVGLALSAEPRRVGYLPLLGDGDTLPDGALAPVLEILADPERPIVGHNVKELVREMLKRNSPIAGIVGDTMLESFLADPAKLVPHRIDQLTKEFLQQTVRPAKAYVGAGKKLKLFSAIPVPKAAEYACHLCDAIVTMWPAIRTEVERTEQLAHLIEHELPLSHVLAQVEHDGILVDKDDLRQMGDDFATRLATIEKRIWDLAGHEFNVGSTKQLSAVLFEELQLPVIKRTKTGYSTASGVLEKLAEEHEIATEVLAWRKLAKLINTYTEVLQRSVNPTTGRIHSTFQQTAGVTGRLITTDPDLQRTPVRTEEGKRIRRAFIASEGNKLLCADWSQIELRVLAHITGDPALCEAFSRGLDIHKRTASQLFDIDVAEVTDQQRGTGKTVNFATIYGQGATALSQQLRISRNEAKAYIERYFEIYGGVRDWVDRTVAQAHKTGFVTTILGRRRYIQELFSNNFMDRQTGERIAANTPIQGSAADICKIAMLEIAARFEEAGLAAKMVLQVHDELIFDVPASETARVTEIVLEVMRAPLPLSVPLVVDLGVGDNWAEAKGA